MLTFVYSTFFLLTTCSSVQRLLDLGYSLRLPLCLGQVLLSTTVSRCCVALCSSLTLPLLGRCAFSGLIHKYSTNETCNGAGQPRYPQAHPLAIQPPSSTSSAVALFWILTERHILRKFAVAARFFSVTFELSVRRLSSLPSVSCATLTGDVTYDSSKRGFPVRYVWSVKRHR